MGIILRAFEEWRSFGPIQKTLVATGSIVTVASLLSLTAALINLFSPEITRLTVPVIDTRIHLGDNTFSPHGGGSASKLPAPGAIDERGTHLLYFDKQSARFSTNMSAPAYIQALVKDLQEEFASHNLAAFRHIDAAAPTLASDDDWLGGRVLIDAGTELVWRENAGDFYARHALVAVTTTLSLHSKVLDTVRAPEEYEVSAAKLIAAGFHGGRRSGQLDNVAAVINGKTYPIRWRKSDVRQTETLVVEIAPSSLSLHPDETLQITLLVLPYEERFPVPPPDSEHPQRGPAHFRDVEFWEVRLDLELSS